MKVTWDSEAIRNLRRRLGYSRSDLSRRLAVSLSQVVVWESGQAKPPLPVARMLEVLSRFCEENVEELACTPLKEQQIDSAGLEQLEIEDLP